MNLPTMLSYQFVPWKKIAYWRCTSCGRCCKDYSVVLSFPEWLNIIQIFGPQTTLAGADKLFVKRLDDGRCAFLCSFRDFYLCSLQHMKPSACKIWPFKVLGEPKYGEPDQAVFDLGKRRFFIYADSNCDGLVYGNPRWEFSSVTLKEFVGIATGLQNVQRSSTRIGNGLEIRRF